MSELEPEPKLHQRPGSGSSLSFRLPPAPATPQCPGHHLSPSVLFLFVSWVLSVHPLGRFRAPLGLFSCPPISIQPLDLAFTIWRPSMHQLLVTSSIHSLDLFILFSELLPLTLLIQFFNLPDLFLLFLGVYF